MFSSFSFSSISPYILTALTLSLLGAIDSLLTSVVADNMTKTKHNSNKELVGQGIGNSIAAVFGGIPGAGATIRTVVNINSGGKTRLSGMIAGVLLLFILLALGPIASKIPAAVLSGILITVGIGVMDYKGLKAIPVLPRDISMGPIRLSSEVLIMLTVLLLSTFWDLIFAVGIGLVISCLMFMKLIGDVTSRESNVEPLKEEAWPDETAFPVALKDSVFIKHIKGPLFFGYTSEFQHLYKQIPDTAKTVVIRLSKMQYMDQTGLYVMEDMLQDLKAKGVDVIFVGLLDQPRYMMERIDIIPDLVSEDRVYKSFKMYLKQLSE
jgi:SulP family sulfate permease